jgi:hypothetical protein
MKPALSDAWTSGPGPDALYAQFLARSEFRIQHCGGCGTHLFCPRMACTRCGGVDIERVAPSGRGVVHAVSIVNRSTERGGPYNVVLVDLTEGPRMMSRVEVCPTMHCTSAWRCRRAWPAAPMGTAWCSMRRTWRKERQHGGAGARGGRCGHGALCGV